MTRYLYNTGLLPIALALTLAACGSDGPRRAPIDDDFDAAAGGAGGSGGRGGSGGSGGRGGSGGSTSTGGSGGSAGSGGSGGNRDGGVDAASVDASGPQDAAPPLSQRDALAGEVGVPTGGPFVLVGNWNGGEQPKPIDWFTVDPATAALTLKDPQLAGGATRPSYLAADPTTRLVYVNDEGFGRVQAFSFNPMTGILAPIGDAVTLVAGKGSAHVAVSPSGRWVFQANYGNGTIAWAPILSDGSVGGGDRVKSENVAVVEGSSNQGHQVVFDPSGKYVYVPSVTDGDVKQFRFDDATGTLTKLDPWSVPVPSARHMAFHPNGKFAFVVSARSYLVTTLKYDAATGKLSDPVAVSSVPPETTGGDAGAPATGDAGAPAGDGGASDAGPTMPSGNYAGQHVVVHPNGKTVYVSVRTRDGISVFDVDATTGKLTLKEFETGGGTVTYPRDFAIDRKGTMLVVGNLKEMANTVASFKIAADGTLTLVGTPTPLMAAPTGILILP